MNFAYQRSFLNKLAMKSMLVFYLNVDFSLAVVLLFFFSADLCNGRNRQNDQKHRLKKQNNQINWNGRDENDWHHERNRKVWTGKFLPRNCLSSSTASRSLVIIQKMCQSIKTPARVTAGESKGIPNWMPFCRKPSAQKSPFITLDCPHMKECWFKTHFEPKSSRRFSLRSNFPPASTWFISSTEVRHKTYDCIDFSNQVVQCTPCTLVKENNFHSIAAEDGVRIAFESKQILTSCASK